MALRSARPVGLLQMPGRVGQVPHVPRRAPVTPGQQDGVASVVVRPPRLVFVGRAMRSKGSGLGRPTSAGRPRPGPTRRRPAPSNPPCRTRQKKSKSSRPKNHSGSGTMPASKTRRDSNVAPQLATSTGTSSYGFPGGRDHVDGVGSSADEPSPVGHHRPDGRARQPVATFGPAHDVGQPRAGKGEEPHVVLAQVGPVERTGRRTRPPSRRRSRRPARDCAAVGPVGRWTPTLRRRAPRTR